jgi:tetratricopeptide (TPR) repeat protein
MVDQLPEITLRRDVLITVAVLAVVPLLLQLRRIYARRYLTHRLFFEPWVNLSGDSTLEIGASLAELLYFELESLRELLTKARRQGGLWNERSSLPLLERLFEGYPDFVRQVELIGLPGRLTRLVQFVLVVRPPRMHGTIHRFGKCIRFQVMLEGIIDEGLHQARHRGARDAGNKSHGAAGNVQLQRVGWVKDLPEDDREAIPEAVAEIAHQIVLDWGGLKAFKFARSFVHFTKGLREHLAFNELHGREEFGLAARKHYEKSIESEGQNPLASYAIAQILYSSYDYERNERAIQEYQRALQSDIRTLRAKAFRGLADAYCQRKHRHNKGEADVLDAAMRWATFAQELCDTTDDPTDEASIKKALAFATQIQAAAPSMNDNQREALINQAMELYEAALRCDPAFTVAYNNLGFLYLERAANRMARLTGSYKSHSDERIPATAESIFKSASEDLTRAEGFCSKATECDPTYHHAYDNLGNVWFQRSLLPAAKVDEALRAAEDCYYKATAYHPTYDAAYADLARLHLRRAERIALPSTDASGRDDTRSQSVQRHVERAWQAHYRCLSVLKDTESRLRRCREFTDRLVKGGEDLTGMTPVGCLGERSLEVGCVCLQSSVRVNAPEEATA